MKIISLVLLGCTLWEAKAYPYYPYYGNMDTLSFGASDNSRGGMAMSRYYSPYYNPRAVGGGMAAFMIRQPEDQQYQPQPSQYYQPDRRQITPEAGDRPLQPQPPQPQENEIYYPPLQVKPTPTELTDIADATVAEAPTTVKAIVPNPVEPEIEDLDEPVQKTKKRVSKKKQVKRPVEDDEEDDEYPKMPAGAFFPMYFGWGGRSSGGGPGGATAIANAYSTGRGGVASSHATAYGMPRPDYKGLQQHQEA